MDSPPFSGARGPDVSNPQTPISIFILGDSFVARLRDYTKHQDRRNLGLSGVECTVIFRGISGGHVPSLWEELDTIRILSPKVVVIQIGSNDLSCHDSDPLAVANDIFKFAKFVQVEFDVSVFICQILFRNVQECRWPCRPDYNTQVTTTNNTIWDLCKNHMAIRYWHHRRMSQNWRQYIDNDGVHLSDIGMTKYYNNIRSIVTSVL